MFGHKIIASLRRVTCYGMRVARVRVKSHKPVTELAYFAAKGQCTLELRPSPISLDEKCSHIVHCSMLIELILDQ